MVSSTFEKTAFSVTSLSWEQTPESYVEFACPSAASWMRQRISIAHLACRKEHKKVATFDKP